MVRKRVGSPRHGGCGEGQSGAEQRSFYAILFLANGFHKIRLRRAEEVVDGDALRRRQKLKRVSPARSKRVSPRDGLDCPNAAIGTAARYPPGRERSRILALVRSVDCPDIGLREVGRSEA